MKSSIKKGFGFGLTSGIITTIGLIVGLYYGTNSEKIVIGGILIIALADSLSDALGIHISEETHNENHKDIWEATLSTLFFKFVFAISFIVPFLIFSLSTAVVTSIVWGLFLIFLFSVYLARVNKKSSIKVVSEHLIIAVVVIIATCFIGRWINHFFQ
ncbi:MAG: hypothetical protein ABH811_02345 [archaeon]